MFYIFSIILVIIRLTSQTELTDAARAGDLALVTRLVQARASIEQTTDDNSTFSDRTALHWASNNGHHDIVDYLIRQGADVDRLCGHFHLTSLMLAAINGHIESVRLLISAGAEVNKTDLYFLNTSLYRASGHGHSAVADMLLECRANINQKNRAGQTALDWALDRRQYEVATLLILRGADTDGVLGRITDVQKRREFEHLILCKQRYPSNDGLDSVAPGAC
jgi:ankyrin repeat protein